MSASAEAIATRNRNNAQHATGPRTERGKTIASQNARKHGFTITTHQLLSNEDPAAYSAFEQEVITIYDPKSPREHLAAIDIAKCRWALRRFDEAELLLLDACLFNDEQTPGETIASLCTNDSGASSRGNAVPTSLDLLMRYRRPWDRRHQEALREFNQARVDRHREERMAQTTERENAKRSQRHYTQEAREKKAARAEREMQHIERLLGFRTLDDLASPSLCPDPLGFVSSPAAPAPQRSRQQSAA